MQDHKLTMVQRLQHSIITLRIKKKHSTRVEIEIGQGPMAHWLSSYQRDQEKKTPLALKDKLAIVGRTLDNYQQGQDA